MPAAATARWTRPQAIAILAGVAGVGISAYLTVVHFAGALPACPANATFNCDAVLSSPYGVIAGTNVPTSLAGIAWFLVSAALWLGSMPRARLAWSAVGLLTVVYLLYVEIVLLGTICLWCTAAHLLVVILFILALAARGEADETRW